MCARYAVYGTPKDMVKIFDLIEPSDLSADPNFNVCPTDSAPVVVRSGAHNELRSYRFGLLPRWAERKDPRLAAKFLNARAETALTKPLYRKAIRERRCLVVANGWYEWKGPKGDKQPWHMHRGGDLIAFGGLYENGTFSVVTVPANSDTEDIHARMPLLLDEPLKWLSELDDDGILAMMQPPAGGSVEIHRVARSVNNVRSSGPELIVPISIGH